MRIDELSAHLERLKTEAIAATGVDADVAADIAWAAPPDPSMGDQGFPCFALARHLKKAPPLIATDVADHFRDLAADLDVIAEVSTAGPYLNIRFDSSEVAQLVIDQVLSDGDRFGADDGRGTAMIEFSSPNTNKPQHLGHVRNNLIGDAVSRILDFAGHEVTRVNLINDRGIHICKSMLAYERFGDGETPDDTGEKGDHFVGRYYVLFNTKFQDEYRQWQSTDEAAEQFRQWLDSPESKRAKKEHGDDEKVLEKAFFDHFENTYFNTLSDLGGQASAMLRRWEEGHDETVALWRQMNQWVFDGFDTTYARFGIEFDRVYRESETYELGRQVVEQGLEDGLFYRRDDGAIVCDLSTVGLSGEKVLLRDDGTTVYMTQDLGTAITRFEEYDPDQMIYVVADEQNYHFDVLFRILGALKEDLKDRFHHLSYGMVELPEGKMKSREGTVVDADDLLSEMESLARQAVDERYADLADNEAHTRARVIGLAALKYYVLDFAPRTTVQFDPQRSIDFQGRTGPYCLYGYARIASLGRRVQGWPDLDAKARQDALHALGTQREMDVIDLLRQWPDTVRSAADQLNPGRVAEFLFELCSAFASLYNDADHRVVDLDGPRRQGLLLLSRSVQQTLANGLRLLGIPTLDEM